jgi:hypothetical protein
MKFHWGFITNQFGIWYHFSTACQYFSCSCNTETVLIWYVTNMMSSRLWSHNGSMYIVVRGMQTLEQVRIWDMRFPRDEVSVFLGYDDTLNGCYHCLTFKRRNVIWFIQGISPYRDVNTFHHGYKNQSVNNVYSKSRWLFWYPYKTLNAERAPCTNFEC